MKKVFSFLAVLALVCMASSAWADIPGAKTAIATFGTVTEIDIDIDLYNVPTTPSDNFYTNATAGTTPAPDSGKIEFSVAPIRIGDSAEATAMATVFAKVRTNLTAISSNFKLRMFTKNMENTSDAYKVYNNAANKKTQNWGGTWVQICRGLIRANGAATKETPDYDVALGDYAPIKMFFSTVNAADKRKYAYSYSGTELSGTVPDVFGVGKDLCDAQDRRHLPTDPDGEYNDTFAEEKIVGTPGAAGGIMAEDYVNDNYITRYAQDRDVIIFFGATFDHVMSGDTYSTETIVFDFSAE